MSVYVDDFQARFGRMIMCHMIADTHEELIAMADKIGVQRKWIQDEGTPYEHFDIAVAKRRIAVQNGAIEVSMRDMVNIRRNKKEVSEKCQAGGSACVYPKCQCTV